MKSEKCKMQNGTARFVFILSFIALFAMPALAQKPQITVGNVTVDNWASVDVVKVSKGNAMTITGPRVHARTLDGKFEAKAKKIVIITTPSGGQTATLTGDVWVIAKPETGRKVEATANRADVDWKGARQAVLTGNVRIETTDPKVFEGPLKLTGDKATISLKPEKDLKPGETRFKIESDPARSKLEFTPAGQSSEQTQSAH